MEPHQERVVKEKEELDDKLTKLEIFVSTNKIFNTLSDEDKQLLTDQYETMEKYSLILEKRINRFK
jgi:hypothetical protein